MTTMENKMKLFVGNLSYQTTKETLEKLFSSFGEVADCNIITDRYTQLPKGFAFVTMGSKEAAEAAQKALNGQKVDGREIVVSEAKPQEQRSDRRPSRSPGNFSSGRGGGMQQKRRSYHDDDNYNR